MESAHLSRDKIINEISRFKTATRFKTTIAISIYRIIKYQCSKNKSNVHQDPPKSIGLIRSILFGLMMDYNFHSYKGSRVLIPFLAHAILPQWSSASLLYLFTRNKSRELISNKNLLRLTAPVYITSGFVLGVILLYAPQSMDRSYAKFLMNTAGYRYRDCLHFKENLSHWCQYAHPEIGCWHNLFRRLSTTVKRLSFMYTILYTTMFIIQRQKMTKTNIIKWLNSIIRSTLFLSIHTGIGYNVQCLLSSKSVSSRLDLKYHPIFSIVACSLSSLSVLIERPQRRIEVTMLIAFRIVEALTRCLREYIFDKNSIEFNIIDRLISGLAFASIINNGMQKRTIPSVQNKIISLLTN